MQEQGAMPALADLLLQTVSARDMDSMKAAEQQLAHARATMPAGVYMAQLLQLVQGLCNEALALGEGAELPPEKQAVCLAGAIQLKQAVRRQWKPSEFEEAEDANKENAGGAQSLSEQDATYVKDTLVDVMCLAPAQVQNQLGEALNIISQRDFPRNWEQLMPQVVRNLGHALNGQGQESLRIVHGIFMTLNSILKKFRIEFDTEELRVDLKHVLDHFAEAHLAVTRYLSNAIEVYTQQQNAELLILTMRSVRLLFRVYLSITSVDFPAFFEDNKEEYTAEFLKYLGATMPFLEAATASQDDSEPHVLEQVQAAIMEIITLCVVRYDDDYQDKVEAFATAIWQLLTRVGPEGRYDNLVAAGMKFLLSTVTRPRYASLFSADNLGVLVEQVVIPNMVPSEADEEIFEFNPTEYIRKDIEGSDADTRRRAATDLVRGMCREFEEPVTDRCLNHISVMLKQYMEGGRETHWKAKDTAINLILAISVRANTLALGAAELNPRVNILELFTSHVLPELQDDQVSSLPMVRASALKFVCHFRSQMTQENILSLLPIFVQHLNSESIVVQTYAAYCIERYLTVKDTDETSGVARSRVSPELVMQHIEALCGSLFAVLENQDIPDNEYVMKAVMRVLVVAGEQIAPVCELVLDKLMSFMERVCVNPRNPHFNHYLFEAMSVLIGSVCRGNAAAVDNFEARLFPPFTQVLQTNVEEIMPYVFQVMTLLLRCRADGAELSTGYSALLPMLLHPDAWSSTGNVLGQVELIRAYLEKALPQVLQNGQLEPILGVFQKLLAAKWSEALGFKLLEAVTMALSREQIGQYVPTIFELLMVRLQESGTVRYRKAFLRYVCLFNGKHGADSVWSTLESMQTGLGVMFAQQVLAHSGELIHSMGVLDQKIALVGCTHFLCHSSLHTNPEAWVGVLDMLIGVFGSRKLRTDAIKAVDEDTSGAAVAATAAASGATQEAIANAFQGTDTTFSRLFYALPRETDPFPDIGNVPAFFAEQLGTLVQSNPQAFTPLLNRLEPKAATALTRVLGDHNVQL